MMAADPPICARCEAPEVRTFLSGVPLCDGCFNDLISDRTGWPRLPAPPEPEQVRAADGRQVAVRYRLLRTPSGVLSAEAEEADVPVGDGFRFQVYGEPEEEVAEVLDRLRHRVHTEIGHAYLEPSNLQVGEGDDRIQWAIAGSTVAGRVDTGIDADGELEHSGPPSVVIDGRRVSWEEFGTMLASFEGWEFRLVLGDQDPAAAEGGGRGIEVPELPEGSGRHPSRSAEDLPGSDAPGPNGPDGPSGPGADGPDAEVIPLFGPRGGASSPTSEPTVDTVLEAFLAAQQARLAPRTFDRYLDIIDLLRISLNSYGYLSLPEVDVERWRAAFDAGVEDSFTATFGPEWITQHYGEFLGYFMTAKVMASTQQLADTGTVTRKLAAWLGEQGYVDVEVARDAQDRARAARRDLPRAEQLAALLYDLARTYWQDPLVGDLDDLDDQDVIEDVLPITEVGPGALWLDGLGPVSVPLEASELARVGWEVNVVLARADGIWRLVEVGSVHP